MLDGYFLDFLDVIFEAQFNKSFDYMVCRNCFFGLLFANFIRFGGDKVNKFDATIDEQIARFFRKYQVIR